MHPGAAATGKLLLVACYGKHHDDAADAGQALLLFQFDRGAPGYGGLLCITFTQAMLNMRLARDVTGMMHGIACCHDAGMMLPMCIANDRRGHHWHR